MASRLEPPYGYPAESRRAWRPRALGRRGVRRRAAVSEVIGSILMTAVLVVSAFGALAFASSYLSQKDADEQFAQAQELAKSIRDLATGLAFQPGASGFLSYRFTAIAPNLIDTGSNLTVTLLNATNSLSETLLDGAGNPLPIRVLRFTGRASTPDLVLHGDTGLIQVGPARSLGVVATNFTQQAEVNLDFARIRVVNNGNQTFYDQASNTFIPWNVLELVVVELVNGTSTAPSPIFVRNADREIEQIVLTGNARFNVTTSYPSGGLRTTELALSDMFASGPNFDPNLDTLVTVVWVRLTVSFGG